LDPTARHCAKGEDALLGARLLFIAARASKGRIKAMRA
jgi:hypothetical protein